MAAGTPSRLFGPKLTPEDRIACRKSQFKRNNTPNWRETYRERCTNRLRQNRHALFDHTRSLNGGSPSQETVQQSIYNVMQEEWDQLSSELNLPKVSITGKRTAVSPAIGANVCKRPITANNDDDIMETNEGFATPSRMHLSREENLCDNNGSQEEKEDDIEYILSLMDEITCELIEEEQSILLLQHEENQKFTESALASIIDSMSGVDNGGVAEEEAVICPICLKNVLVQNKQFIYCVCGVRIDTEQDGITLDYVRRQLKDGSTSHSQSCSAIPVFKTDGVLGLQNLVMTCSVCDFMYIIL